ncbi:hypothetical protein FRC04_008347 [Tulasnella sp. 424]|nr:hypothetical protein FRC04_008347 [Tulasnella sp. 424]
MALTTQDVFCFAAYNGDRLVTSVPPVVRLLWRTSLLETFWAWRCTGQPSLTLGGTLPASWFEDDWEVAAVYPNHVLFVHKAEKKRAVMVYNISDTKISLLEVKYESAGLSYDGRFLLVTREKFLYVHSVETSKVI